MNAPNRTPRVLFVDDDIAVTQGIRTSLRKSPFEVFTAHSGQEGLELLAESPFDVVVSDERMPRMSGSEFLSRVRELYPDTMRLILSGQADLRSAITAINDGGIFRFLLKPCEPRDLAACVMEALDAQSHKRRFQRWSEGEHHARSAADSKLDRALDTLHINFQPIFRQASQDVFAFEALVRVTQPGQLFGLAEALERIPEVDTLIRAAIAQRAPEVPAGARLFVNVHPTSLADERLFDPGDPLAAFAHRIVLEVTEQSSLHESSSFGGCIERLRTLGYRIALDDLGAGYAGLTSFAMLSPDVVKFDMGLIRGIHTDPTRQRLIQSITTLCREMDIHVVAEGVESNEEYRCVAELGCDLVQGFLLGRPRKDFAVGSDAPEQAA